MKYEDYDDPLWFGKFFVKVAGGFCVALVILIVAALLLGGCTKDPTEPVGPSDIVCKRADNSTVITVAATGRSFEVTGEVCYIPVSGVRQTISGPFSITIFIPAAELATWK